MPRQSKSVDALHRRKTLVIDNGGYTIKAGFSSPAPSLDECRVIPNCIARSPDTKIWVASDLEQCTDFGLMAFRRPVEQGYLVDWELERAIWAHSFFQDSAELKCDPHETNLILTEAPNPTQHLQTNCDQMIFEEFEFASYYRCIGPTLNCYNDTASLFSAPSCGETANGPGECSLLIDSGYSSTVVIPTVRGQALQQAIRRLDVGGKFLTNHLSELLAVRATNLFDEPYLVNQIKETVCYVSQAFTSDLEATSKHAMGRAAAADTSIAVDYVLPDYVNAHRGEVRPHDPSLPLTVRTAKTPQGNTEQILGLGNVRFQVPETLFNPSDANLPWVGLPEVVMQSLAVVPEGLWPAMLSNIVVVGGNANLPGFMERLERELRSLAPARYMVRIASPTDPVKYTWLGGARLASDPDTLKSLVVTRQEYQEQGANWLLRRFQHTTS